MAEKFHAQVETLRVVSSNADEGRDEYSIAISYEAPRYPSRAEAQRAAERLEWAMNAAVREKNS